MIIELHFNLNGFRDAGQNEFPGNKLNSTSLTQLLDLGFGVLQGMNAALKADVLLTNSGLELSVASC